MANRHTISYLNQRLAADGTRPKHRFGQNFLIDLNLIELITRTADISSNDVILEVGTGTGSLTSHMAPLAGRIVTVEVDPDMQRIAAEELAEFTNIRLLSTDALAGKNEVHPNVLEAIQAAMNEIDATSWKLVANLPYNIATPLMANLMSLPNPPARMVVTVQNEMAERVTAVPSTKDYSALSIWMQSQAECRIIRKLSPSVFWPRPKVDSAILDVVFRPELRSQISNLGLLQMLLRNIFQHRRKLIVKQLEHALPAVSKDDIVSLLDRLEIAQNQRAEQLDVRHFVAIANELGAMMPPS